MVFSPPHMFSSPTSLKTDFKLRTLTYSKPLKAKK